MYILLFKCFEISGKYVSEFLKQKWQYLPTVITVNSPAYADAKCSQMKRSLTKMHSCVCRDDGTDCHPFRCLTQSEFKA